MSPRLALRLTLFLAVCLATVTLHSQTPAVPRSPANAVKLPPPIPISKSPVDLFRDLLAMTPAARENYLAKKSPTVRQRILAKVHDYEAMTPSERELRLRATDLRWYVLSIMQAPAGDHAAQLAMVPEAERQLVADRLQEWEQFPAEEQKAVLKYEKTMEQFEDKNLDVSAATNSVKSQIAPPQRPDSFQNLDNFLQLPPDQRKQMYASFQKFFDLTDAEKQKTLRALPVAQRAQTAGAMQTLASMSPEEREQYLKAVNRFSNMSDAERREFMKNAQQWQQLTPAERQAWRSLVKHLTRQPPLPPGVILPPMPPRHIPLQVSATNANHVSP